MRTDTIRNLYHQTVANHDIRGTDGYRPLVRWIDGETCTYLNFPASPTSVFKEPVHIATVPAFKRYIELMHRHGVWLPSAGGVNSARNIVGSNWPSLHAYLVAVDMPPNSYKPAAFQEAVLALRCNDGAPVFKNLSGDRMHDQIDCAPKSIATGIAGDIMPSTYRDVTNVEPWETAVYDWAIDNGIVRNEDEHPDDARTLLDDGRFLALLKRYHDNLSVPGTKGDKGDQGPPGPSPTNAIFTY